MVLTRIEFENISKQELIEQLVSHDDIVAKFSKLTKRFDKFSDKYETFHSELKITQNCNSLLLERVYQLERNGVSNLQYHRRGTLEINLVPLTIQDSVLEKTVGYGSSNTNEVIRAISSLVFIFFLQKNFTHKKKNKKAQKRT